MKLKRITHINRSCGKSARLGCLLVQAMVFTAAAQALLTIEADRPVAQVSPTFYGLMTEEINYSYDGGLYAELVRNRAFRDNSQKPESWSVVAEGGASAEMALDPQQPLNAAIPASLRLAVSAASPGARAGVANSGYWGFPVKPATTYQASFYAKAAPGFGGAITLSLVSEDGATVYASARVAQIGEGWKAYATTLATDGKVVPTTKARLVLSVEQPGTIWLGFVSLFPPTWKNQPNGFRPDLMQMLVDLHPKFLRFPGGNYLEGNTIETRFDWKQTLGPVEQRPGHPSPWGYRSTDGMGLAEFLRWGEDMGAAPVLAVYAGYSLQGAHVEPGEKLQPFVQDALDEIEYVTGPVTSTWGARRAKDGHPAPYPLHYVEIGNEDFFDKSGSYDGRFAQFYDAIKAKYPQLECIATVGNEQPEGRRVHSRRPDLVDEHYYSPVAAFLKESGRFDNYDRRGPAIFVGEWAAYETAFVPWDKRSEKEAPTPNLRAALGDAAWMAAMERNSDFIKLNCYAPLLVNVHGRQWRPDLIGYDALHVYGSPSYYACQMFSRNVGDEILPARLIAGASQMAYSVTRDRAQGEIIIKLVNPQPLAQVVRVRLVGVHSVNRKGTASVLEALPESTNDLENRKNVVPVTSELSDIGREFEYGLAANAVAVLKIKAK